MSNVVQIQTAPATFEEFWRLYPRKVGKPVAKAKWDAITSEAGLSTRTKDRDSETFIAIDLQATPEEIIAGVRRYRETVIDKSGPKWALKDGGRYILHPATYLNQGRWMDE